MTDFEEINERISKYYRNAAVARSYDDVRFHNAGGQVVDQAEKAALVDLLGNIPKDAPLVEIAPGTGRFALMFARLGYRVVCVDRSIEMLRVVRERANVEGLDIVCVQADAFRLPFADAAFRYGYCIRLIWHFRDYSRLIGELARIVGGRLVFDTLQRRSLAWLTACVANQLVHRDNYMHTATNDDMQTVFRNHGLVAPRSKEILFFPYFFYRRLPILAPTLKAVDSIALRIGLRGSVQMYCLEGNADSRGDDPAS